MSDKPGDICWFWWSSSKVAPKSDEELSDHALSDVPSLSKLLGTRVDPGSKSTKSIRFNSRQFVGRSTLLSIVMMRSPELIFDKIGQGLNESLSHDTSHLLGYDLVEGIVNSQADAYQLWWMGQPILPPSFDSSTDLLWLTDWAGTCVHMKWFRLSIYGTMGFNFIYF